jgi:hypothetical protein
MNDALETFQFWFWDPFGNHFSNFVSLKVQMQPTAIVWPASEARRPRAIAKAYLRIAAD